MLDIMKVCPGVTVDEYGNRVFITFLVTPEGFYTTRLFAHPEIMKRVNS